MTELTKKKIPHLHLLVNGLGDQVETCSGKAHSWKNWLKNTTCLCLEHVWARLWYRVTGDSFLVCVRPVWETRGAVNYMAKYLQKTFDHRDEYEARGYLRRWSCSRNWPRSKAEIAGKDTWLRSEMVNGVTSDMVLDHLGDASANPLFHLVGTDLEMEVSEYYVKSADRVKADKVRSFSNAGYLSDA